jgi:hypothetical protein
MDTPSTHATAFADALGRTYRGSGDDNWLRPNL